MLNREPLYKVIGFAIQVIGFKPGLFVTSGSDVLLNLGKGVSSSDPF
jgi:hypothetical protein